jgi:hypothetical protein
VIIVNLVVESVVTRIREKLLEFDFNRQDHRVKASHALCRGGRAYVAGDQNAVVQAL